MKGVREVLPCMMPLLHDNERNAGLVVSLELDTSFTHSRELMLQDVNELTFGYPVTVHDNSIRLVTACAFVEHDKKLPEGRTTNVRNCNSNHVVWSIQTHCTTQVIFIYTEMFELMITNYNKGPHRFQFTIYIGN